MKPVASVPFDFNQSSRVKVGLSPQNHRIPSLFTSSTPIDLSLSDPATAKESDEEKAEKETKTNETGETIQPVATYPQRIDEKKVVPAPTFPDKPDEPIKKFSTLRKVAWTSLDAYTYIHRVWGFGADHLFGHFRTDTNGFIVAADAELETILGMSLDEMRNGAGFRHIYKEDLPIVHKSWFEAVKFQAPFFCKYRTCVGSELSFVLSESYRMVLNGIVCGFEGILMSVTEEEWNRVQISDYRFNFLDDNELFSVYEGEEELQTPGRQRHSSAAQASHVRTPRAQRLKRKLKKVGSRLCLCDCSGNSFEFSPKASFV